MGKERTLYYRRVRWLSNGGHELQAYTDRAHRRLRTTAQRTFDYRDGQLQGIKYHHERGASASFLHITYYVPKQPTSLVPDPGAVQSADTVSRNPPPRHSYMEGDVFMLIKGNDVILCSSGAREGAAKRYLAAILDKCGVDDPFDLDQVANLDKVAMLQQEGVKRIRLGSSVSKASCDYLERKTKKTELMGKVAEKNHAYFRRGGCRGC